MAASAVMVAGAQDEGPVSGDPLTPPDPGTPAFENETISPTPDPTSTPVPESTPTPLPDSGNISTPTPTPAPEATPVPAPASVVNFEVPAWEYLPAYAWYKPTPTPSPLNVTGNITVATPASTGPTPVPTPLAPDISREHTGTGMPSTVAMLLGLVSAGFLAGIGYLLIRK